MAATNNPGPGTLATGPSPPAGHGGPGGHDEGLILPGHSFASVTDAISQIVLTKPSPGQWWLGFTIAASLLGMFIVAVLHLLFTGVGVWGVNVPVGWGFDIINFVWWIGIGHAGTLISAVLLLFRQHWRTSINRFAEAMTLFAVACAGMYPILHMGRPWRGYFILPYPNTMGLWPQFRSPLLWDVFAISTYALTSLMFWFVGLIPDLATLRDHARHRLARWIYGIFAMGWRGSARHWHRYQAAYMLLAALATPLVLSVHTIVGFDFAISQLPGWHSTFVPPYFVAGAIFAGFAMVITLMVPIRKIYHLEDFITDRHLDNMGKVILATGWIVFYAYIMEAFFGWYSGNQYEEFMILNRMTGPYRMLYWALILCNGLIPQLLWIRRVRITPIFIFMVSMAVNVGMWLERYVIVVISLHRDFMPSSWGSYSGTKWDWMTFIGSIGLFLTLLFLFIRFLPMISIFEMREMLEDSSPVESTGTLPATPASKGHT